MTSLAAWQPDRRVFLRRAAVNAALTFLIAWALLLALSSYWQIDWRVGFALALIAAGTGLYEDLIRWRRVKAEHWQIERPHLIHDGADGRAMIALSEIEQVRVRFGGTLVVKLRSGQRILMRYLEAPNRIAQALAPPSPRAS